MNEHMRRRAEAEAARDALAERRELAEREADREERAAAARMRAVQRWQSTGIGDPDGAGVALGDVLGRIRDSREREHPEEPLVVLGVPEPVRRDDPVERVRARRAARVSRVEAANRLRDVEDAAAAWRATALDAGVRPGSGLSYAWDAFYLRRAAGQR